MQYELQNFYLQHKEPIKGCFLALRDIILSFDNSVTEEWKYSTAFFYYKNKPFCYLWSNKKSDEPYIGITKGIEIDHPLLEQGNRTKMKILPINPCADIPVESILEVLLLASHLY
jgi:hypothetical protein